MLDIFIIDGDLRRSAALREICIKYFIQKNIDSEIIISDTVKEQSSAAIYMLAFGSSLEAQALKIKGNNSRNYIIVLVENSRELMMSVRPPVCPSGFIMKPYGREDTEIALNNIYADYRRCCTDDNDGLFTFKVKAKNYSVPYSRIIFFESDRKKVIARTEIQEFEFYSTLDNVLQAAPDYFIRVHKSYVVNINHIISVDFGALEITFDDGSRAYFSRTYRDELKTALDKRTVKT